MADAQKVIELVFNGVDKTGAAVSSAISNTSKLSGSIQDATQPIADFTAGALKFEAALLGAGLAATVFAVKIAGDFDGAFREISTLIDKPIEDLGEFRQAILDYARTSTQPLESVTLSIYNAISAGVDFADSIEAVAQAEKLAVAGKADLNDTLRVLVSSLNAYGLGMDDAERFSDALFQTVKLGQTTLPELANSLALITGTAATLEIPFETILSAIAALTAQGTPTTQAITQINAAMAALLKPSAEASKVAAELGIEFNAQAVKAKGLETVLQEVAVATGGNEELMGKLFGSTEALRAVFPLTGKAAESFADALEKMRNGTGSTQEAFEKMADALNLSGQKIANAFTGLMVEIGDPLLDEFGGIAEAIAGIFNALGANIAQGGGLGDLVNYVETLMQELEGTISEVAKNLPAALEQADFSAFSKGIDSVVNAFKLLFNNIDLSTVDGLTKAIEIAGAAFLGLSNFTAGVIESFKPLFDILSDVASNIDGVDESFGKSAGSIAGFAAQVNIVAGQLPGVLNWLEALLGILVLKEAGGLVKAFGGAAAGATSLGTAMSSAGLAASALIGYRIGEWLTSFDVVEDSSRALGSSIADLVFWFQNLGNSADEITKLFVPFADLKREASSLYVDIDSLTVPFENLTRQSRLTGDEMLTLSAAMLNSLAASREGASAAFEYAGSLQAQEDAAAGLTPIFDEITGAIIRYEKSAVDGSTALDAFDSGAGKLSKISEETKKAEEAQRLWNQEIQKMQFETGLALIEQQTEITTTRIMAQAEIVKAAYESINVTVQSTGETITDLYGIMAGGGLNLSESFGLERQIDIENERRGEALELQKELTKAQIKEMEARASSLARGDSLITINGDGLQPHLEAFMYEILNSIQVRVNSEGYEMLLGV